MYVQTWPKIYNINMIHFVLGFLLRKQNQPDRKAEGPTDRGHAINMPVRSQLSMKFVNESLAQLFAKRLSYSMEMSMDIVSYTCRRFRYGFPFAATANKMNSNLF